MDCREFEERLDELVGDTLSREERRAACEHTQACARCRELRAVFAEPHVTMASAAPVADPGDALTRAIIARTTGPACSRAGQLLPDYTDGRLGDEDRELLAGHLDHCPHCAALARILADLTATLPHLAEIEPDDDFLPEVLARTSGRPRPAVSGMAAWWQRLLHRPRFALEAAFCGALILMLVTGGPGTVLHDAAPRRIAASWTSPLEDTRQFWQHRGQSARRVAEIGEAAWTEAVGPLEQKTRGIRTWTRSTTQRIRGVLGVVQQHAQRTESAISGGDWARAWVTVCELRQTVPQAWRTAPAGPAADHEDGAVRRQAGGDPDESTEPGTPRLRHQPVNGDGAQHGVRDR